MSDRQPIDLPRVPPRSSRLSRGRQAGIAAGVLAAMAAAAVLGSALASRGTGDDGQALPAPSPTTAAPSATPSPAAPSPAASPSPRAPSPTPAPSSSTDAQGRVVDGTDIGLLVGVDDEDGRAVLRLDRVVFLTGEAARAEATRRGEPADTDYYVQNDNPLVRGYPVSQDVTVTLSVPLSGKDTTEPEQTDLDGLVKALGTQRDAGAFLFDLVVRGGVVVEVKHRYLP